MTLPAYNKRIKAHLIQVRISQGEARFLEQLRVKLGARSWSAVLVKLLMDAHAQESK